MKNIVAVLLIIFAFHSTNAQSIMGSFQKQGTLQKTQENTFQQQYLKKTIKTKSTQTQNTERDRYVPAELGVQFNAFLTGNSHITSLPSGYARVILTAGNLWNDSTGYQMLLDANANTYGTTIPILGPLTQSGNVPDSIYDKFEYKIPTNADGKLNTKNIVLNASVAIDLPAGTYDYCITNPTPKSGTMWIANGAMGRENDFVFEQNKIYRFFLVRAANTDSVILIVQNAQMPSAVSNFSAKPDSLGALHCKLSWVNPSTDVVENPLTELTTVVVRRNDTVIHSINNPQIGASETWTDTTPSVGTAIYSIFATNTFGTSAIVGKSVYIGLDPCANAVTDYPYLENFENPDSTLDCWRVQYVSGQAGWRIRAGNGINTGITKAHSGLYNASMTNFNYVPAVAKLITLKYDLSTLSKPVLRFWHAQPEWEDDQDELRVYYRVSQADDWTFLTAYTVNIPDWTEHFIALPDTISECYIAFEGTAKWGKGVAVDDVRIEDLPEHDAYVIEMNQPNNGANLSNAEPVAVVVRNTGATTITNLPVYLKIDNQLVASDTITVPIASLTQYTHTFTHKADLSGVKTYTLTACINLVADIDNSNDTISKQITNYGDIAIMGDIDNVTTCDMPFVDDGVYGNYDPHTNETQTITFFPPNIGDKIQVTFKELNVSAAFLYMNILIPGDTLFVYSGMSADKDKLLSALTGDFSANLPQILSESEDGTLTFVFRKASGSSKSGWNADIKCVTPLVNDAGVVSVISPSKGGSAAEKVTIKIKNFGSTPITSLDVAYRLNGAMPIVETFSGNLTFAQTAEFTFETPVDISEYGSYKLTAYSLLPNDLDRQNDTINYTLEYRAAIKLYGYRLFSITDTTPAFVSFMSNAPNVFTIENKYTDGEAHPRAGDYVQEKLYASTFSINEETNAQTPVNFVQLTKNWSPVASVPTEDMPNDMAYDHSTNTMYAISLPEGALASELYTVNLETGAYTLVASTNQLLLGLACNLEGKLFAMATSGMLYSIDKETANSTMIGNTGLMPVFVQSIAFDHNSGRLFWTFLNKTLGSKLVEINPTTGAATLLGNLGDGFSEVVMLYTPYSRSSITNAKPNNTEVRIYPNPATDKVNVENAAGTIAKIFSISGTLVLEQKLQKNKEEIIINRLSPGIYFIDIQNQNIKTTKKLIKK